MGKPTVATLAKEIAEIKSMLSNVDNEKTASEVVVQFKARTAKLNPDISTETPNTVTLKADSVSIWDGTGFQNRLSGDGWQLNISPGKQVYIKTGCAMVLPEGYEATLRNRPINAVRDTLIVATPTIFTKTTDQNRTGEIGVVLFNAGPNQVGIEQGDPVAELVINSIPTVEFKAV